jgi:hypothetical protein
VVYANLDDIASWLVENEGPFVVFWTLLAALGWTIVLHCRLYANNLAVVGGCVIFSVQFIGLCIVNSADDKWTKGCEFIRTLVCLSFIGLAFSSIWIALNYNLSNYHREYGPCELGDWTGWNECYQAEEMYRTRLVTSKGRQVSCDTLLSETRPCSVDCDVHPWDTWSSCEAASGRKHHARSVRTWPTKSGEQCPSLDESVPCAVDCALTQWNTWSSCSASCGGGTCSRSRSVLIHAKNGGTPCGQTDESAECNKVPCFVLQLNDTLQRDCSIARASELHTVLITLLAAGVESVDDICLLEHAQLQPSLSSSGPIANSVVKMLPDGAGAGAMLPVTQKKLLQCICSRLCKSLGSPLCAQTQQKVDQVQREDSLVEWIHGSCDVTVGTKEVVDALQALGVEKIEDLRHTTDAMVDGLAGVSPVRRQKMRACLRAFHEKEL